MKRFAFIFFLLLVGCSTPTNSLMPQIIENQQQRLEVVGQLSTGVQYAIAQDKPAFASTLNDSVIVLSEKPTQAQVLEIKTAVDEEVVSDKTNQAVDALSQTAKDVKQATLLRVSVLEKENADLEQRNEAISTELQQFDSGWFSIKHGVMTILKKLAWWLTGFGVVFLVLRILSGSNPLFSAIFGVFEHFVATIFRAIASMLPRVFTFAGYIKTETADLRKTTLKKVVDNVQAMRDKEEIKKLREELSKSMNADEKQLVDEVKRELGY